MFERWLETYAIGEGEKLGKSKDEDGKGMHD